MQVMQVMLCQQAGRILSCDWGSAMSEKEMQVYRSEGWDEEKGESYERISCPVCGFTETLYEKGDLTIEREGNHSGCPCCSGEELSAPVTPDEYGTSYQQTDEEGGCGCMVIGFVAFFAVSLFICLLVNLFGTQ